MANLYLCRAKKITFVANELINVTKMSPLVVIITLAAYLLLLFVLSRRAAKGADNASFFIGGRRTSWYAATLAMIGAAMSGVSFISVPGAVAADSFSYMQMVVGFTIGQLIVAFVLVPTFYKRKVVSLYEWLEERFGSRTHRTGAWCFLVAKVVGAALKIYIVCSVMQILVFDHFNIGFTWNILLTMLIVWLYTRTGGVRSLIPTDILQSVCLVASVAISIWLLMHQMNFDFRETVEAITASSYSRMWFFDDPASPRYFWKMVAGGALCLVAMTGLDQDMMQRNMSCRTKHESQINIVLTALCQIFVILLFLSLGALIYLYIDYAGLPAPAKGDDAFALVAVGGGLPLMAGVVFVIGLISSTYSAAGASLTALTTAFTVDVMDGRKRYDESSLKGLRHRTHVVMALILAAMVILFERMADGSIINLVFKVAGYTYGPILGMFAFGFVSKRAIDERFMPLIAILSPILAYLLQWFATAQYGYQIGFELLGYNALITIFGMILISKKRNER